MSSYRADAIVLAGGDGSVIDPTVRAKGQVPVLGRPMVEWVVDALLAADTVRDVIVVTPTTDGLEHLADKVTHLVVNDGSFIENGLAGFAKVRGDLHVVWATGDVPALTPEAVDDVVNRTLDSGADFSYPLISKGAIEAEFPGSVRTFFKIARGTYTGGNVVVTPAQLADGSLTDLFQEFYDSRKSVVKTLKIVGPGFAAKLALGTLDTPDIEAKLSKLFRAPCHALYDPHPSVGADVDKPIDRVVVERALELRARRQAS